MSQSQVMLVSLDGGQSYQPAPDGVRVIYRDILVGEAGRDGEVHINLTEEGMAVDGWSIVDGAPDELIGSKWSTLDDLTAN